MRIAIVAHGITDQSMLGGPGRVAAEHAKGLAGAGHQVTVYTSNLVWKGKQVDTPTFDLLGDDNIPVKWVPAFSFERWPGSVGPVISKGGRAMMGEAVAWADVVHAHEWPHGLVQAARTICQRRRVGFVVQPHGSIQVRPRGWKEVVHRWYNALHRVTEKDNFIAGTQREAAEIGAVLRANPKIFQLGNPVPPPAVRPGDPAVAARRASWGFPPDARVVLFAHRIAPNKGLDIAIRALGRLPERYCLAVIGQDGGYPAYGDTCRKLVTDLGLETRVRFPGPVGRTEVDEIILAADVFLLPARHDIFPLMVMHALACRRPVVMSSACQSAEELEESAVIVDPEPPALAEAIASLSEDKVRRLTASGAALMADRYALDAVVARLETIYGEICARVTA